MQIEKEEIKLFLFADDMSIYIKILKKWQKRKRKRNDHLELMNCNKVTGYQVNTQKSMAFLFAHNEKPELDI